MHAFLLAAALAAADVTIDQRHPGAAYRFPSGDALAARYRVTVGFEAFEAYVPVALPAPMADQLMREAAALYQRVPRVHRRALHQVAFDPRPWRGGGYTPGFVAAATGGGHTMHFYRNDAPSAHRPGGYAFDQRVFMHEMGHVVADAFWRAHSPDRWEHAAMADGNLVSDYAKLALRTSGGYQEDFGDAYELWTRTLDDPTARAAFRARFPARAEVLAELFTRDAF